MQIIEYQDYDKISDDMFYLGNNIIMKFNVLLSRKASATDNSRRFFHSEYRYRSKYNDTDSGVSIKRSFSYYISFDVGSNWENSVMIRVQDILLLRQALDEVSQWMSKGVFTIVDNKLSVMRTKTVKVTGLPENKYIWIDPVILDYNGKQSPGVRMTFSDPSTYADIGIDTLFGLKYLVDTADMFGYAQSALNYISRPPEYGFNMIDFEDEYKESMRQVNKPVKASPGRQIPGVKKNKSAFESDN